MSTRGRGQTTRFDSRAAGPVVSGYAVARRTRCALARRGRADRPYAGPGRRDGGRLPRPAAVGETGLRAAQARGGATRGERLCWAGWAISRVRPGGPRCPCRSGWPFLAHSHELQGHRPYHLQPAAWRCPATRTSSSTPRAPTPTTPAIPRPDFPYTLAGWATASPTRRRVPSFSVHGGGALAHPRARVHPIDSGGIAVMPPSEDGFGASPGGFSDRRDRPVVGFPLRALDRPSLARLERRPESASSTLRTRRRDRSRRRLELLLPERAAERLLDPRPRSGDRRRSRAARPAQDRRRRELHLKVAARKRSTSRLEADLAGSSKRPTSGRSTTTRASTCVGTVHPSRRTDRACPLRRGRSSSCRGHRLQLRGRRWAGARPDGRGARRDRAELGFEPRRGRRRSPPGAAPPSQGARSRCRAGRSSPTCGREGRSPTCAAGGTSSRPPSTRAPLSRSSRSLPARSRAPAPHPSQGGRDVSPAGRRHDLRLG